MRQSTFLCLGTAVLLMAAAVPARADAIPYPNAGTIAPSNTFTATGTSITGYYYGSSAGDTDELEIVDLTKNINSGFIFQNTTTAVGTSFTFNGITAGDTIEFLINNETTHLTFSSIAANSPDGDNHAYSTPYTDLGSTAKAGIPAGIFVGMEDERVPGSDLDYNDLQLVFTQVSATPTASTTPEPAGLLLLGTGVALCVLWKKRRAYSAA